LILHEMDAKNHVKVKDVQFETVSFGIDFRTYEQIQQLLLSEKIQKQKGYHHMLDQPPSFLRVVFDEANFVDIIKRRSVSKRKPRLNETDPYYDYTDVLSEFSSQGPSRLGVFSDEGVSVHSRDFELKVGLILINTALNNVKQVAKHQDDRIQRESSFPEELFESYDIINVALANCHIIRDHIISSLRLHEYLFRIGKQDDNVPAPFRPNRFEHMFKDVSDYLKLKVVVEHETQPRSDTQGKLVFNLSFDIRPIGKYVPFVRPHMSHGGKSKRSKRSKRVKRSKTCKNRVHKRRN